MTTNDSSLPLDLRLRTLEAQIFGVPPALSAEPPFQHAEGRKPLMRRTREVQEALERAATDSDALKRLLNGYAQYLPLLSLPTTAIEHGDDGGAEDKEGMTQADLLPDTVKLAMVLEAAWDIKAAERDLREVEVLRGRGADGAGALETLLPYKNDLVTALKASEVRSQQLHMARQDVADLLNRYSTYTSAVSEMFLELHRRVETMEDAVAGLERKKRQEAAARY